MTATYTPTAKDLLRRGVVLTLLLGVVGGLWFLLPDPAMLWARQAEIRHLVQQHCFEAVLIYFVGYVVAVAVSLPIGIWLTLLGGWLFGRWLGFVVVLGAATLGATLAMAAVRYLFRDWVQKGRKRWPRFDQMARGIDAGIERAGMRYLILIRLTPIVPFFVVNLVVGLTNMRLTRAALASALGMALPTWIYVNAAASVAAIESVDTGMTWELLLAWTLLIWGPLVLRRLVRRFWNELPTN